MNLIRSALDWLGWERLTDTRARHDEQIKLLHKIMATQAELIAQVNTLTTQLAAATESLAATNLIVVKVGTETDGLLQKIADLETAIQNQTDASPELVAAFASAQAQANALSNTAGQLSVNAAVDDSKVPDPSA